MGNGYGDARISRYEDMDAYDAAPPRLRWLIRYAVASWSVKHLVEAYRDLLPYHGTTDALRRIASAMIADEQSDTALFYGPTHPEAAQRDH